MRCEHGNLVNVLAIYRKNGGVNDVYRLKFNGCFQCAGVEVLGFEEAETRAPGQFHESWWFPNDNQFHPTEETE